MQLNGPAEWFARHRGWLAGVIVALTSIGLFGTTRLGFDDLPMNVFKTEQADFELLQTLFADFGSDDGECVIVVEGDPLFSPQGAELLRSLTTELRQVKGIEAVRSLADVAVLGPDGRWGPALPRSTASIPEFAAAQGVAESHPLIGGHLLSRDGNTTLVIASLEGDSLPISEVKPRVLAIQEVLAKFAAPNGFRLRLTGVPPIRYEIFSSIRRDSVRLMLLGTCLAFLMATLLFRRFWAVLVVAIPPLLAAVWAVGFLGLIGEKFNVLNTILPVLVMIVGFTDSVHLMFDVRHSLARGLSSMAAAKSAIVHLGAACALTSFTTAIGFGSLMVTSVDMIRKLGMVCAVGAVLAFVSTILLVPLLASSTVGPRLAAAAPARVWSRASVVINRWAAALSLKLIDAIIAHAGWVTLGGVLVVAGMGVLATRLAPNNRLTENIPETNESAQALFHIDKTFGGLLPSFVLVEWDESHELGSATVLSAIEDAQRLLESHSGVGRPISILNLLRSLPGDHDALATKVSMLSLVPSEVVNRFVRPQRRRAVVEFYLPDLGTKVHEPMFRSIEQSLAEIQTRYPGVRLDLTGTAVVASRNINQMIADLAKSLGLATLVIFTTMTLVFRSWRLGFISLLPNAFPLLATAAWLVITGRPLELTSVIVFSICLGIAVDDTIHVINRFGRELRDGHAVRPAIKQTFLAVGSALVTTTVVLLVGFGSVAISEMPPSQLFAELGALAIFAALIGDLVILPAMLVFFLGGKPDHQPI